MATNIMMIRDGTLTLGAVGSEVSVECQMTNMTISATPDPKELTTVCGKVTVPGITAFVLNLEGAQDWGASGVSTYLYENDGELVDFSLKPTATAQPIATGKVYIAPGDFGGVAGEIAVFSVSLGIDGKPTITPAAAAAVTTVPAEGEAEPRPEPEPQPQQVSA